MDPITLGLIITAALKGAEFLAQQLAISKAEGKITPEQAATIEAAGKAADDRFDANLADAQAKLVAGGN